MWEIITTDRFDNWFDNLDDANRGEMIPIADAEYKTHLEGMEKRNG
jgi:hypothetical protein